MVTATKWVVTIFTPSEPTVHLEAKDKAELLTLMEVLEQLLGRVMIEDFVNKKEVPIDWRCDGTDGCVV